ncbi:MAG: hypothetical protein KDK78_05185 [Chlamydiia bacterium]|nr:hypothetical protein [Chlamydiia bacterium]
MSAIERGYLLIQELVQHGDEETPLSLTDEKVDQIRAALLHPEEHPQDSTTLPNLSKTLLKCSWESDPGDRKDPFHLLQPLIDLGVSANSQNASDAQKAQSLLSALVKLRETRDETALNELLASGETVTVELCEASGIQLDAFLVLQDEQGKLVALLRIEADSSAELVTVTKDSCSEYFDRASPAALASMVNRCQIPLTELDIYQQKETLPLLRYCDLRHLSHETQADLLNKLNHKNINYLYINSSKIETLPEGMSKLLGLNCAGCLLTSLPKGMSKLQGLNCYNCPQLRSLPEEMSELEILICQGCPLPSLPEGMGELLDLDCSNCPQLSSLPTALPNLRRLDISNCPLLQGRTLPEMPADVQVITGDAGFAFSNLNVPMKEIAERPLDFLIQLGRNYLLKGKPFPNITYFEPDGSRSRAVDAGGVRRDFVSTILEHLFTEDDSPSKLQRVDGIPRARNDAEQEAYQSLGRLLGLCYLGTQTNFVSGLPFGPNFYRALCAYPDTTNTALALMDISEDAWAKWTPDQDIDEPLEDLMLNFTAPQNVGRYQALKWIAQEMQALLGEERWNQLQASTPDALKTTIEGSLDKDQIKKALTFSGGNPSEQLEAAKGWFSRFLDEADTNTLKDFLRAITSSNSLRPGSTITIGLYDRDPQQFPIAHTCFNTLELPVYPSYEKFKEKLQYLLAQAKEGFDIA